MISFITDTYSNQVVEGVKFTRIFSISLLTSDSQDCHTADGIARDLSKSRVPLLVSKIENEHLLKIYATVEQVQLHREKNDSYVCHIG